jgi:hypothetical protein
MRKPRFSKSAAARVLGISRRTVIRYVERKLITQDARGRVRIDELMLAVNRPTYKRTVGKSPKKLATVKCSPFASRPRKYKPTVAWRGKKYSPDALGKNQEWLNEQHAQQQALNKQNDKFFEDFLVAQLSKKVAQLKAADPAFDFDRWLLAFCNDLADALSPERS